MQSLGFKSRPPQKRKRFKGLVEGVWRKQSVEGWTHFVLKKKLKRLKFGIKEWHKVEYGNVEDVQ